MEGGSKEGKGGMKKEEGEGWREVRKGEKATKREKRGKRREEGNFEKESLQEIESRRVEIRDPNRDQKTPPIFEGKVGGPCCSCASC